MDIQCVRTGARIEGDKRACAPYRTRWTCPDCGTQHEANHEEHYFSYPIAGASQRFSLYCHVCDEAGRPYDKGDVELRYDVVVTLVAVHPK